MGVIEVPLTLSCLKIKGDKAPDVVSGAKTNNSTD